MLDSEQETKARNERRMSALFLNNSSGFEVIQGVLDLIMTKIGAEFAKDYRLVGSDSDPMYFPKRGALIELNGENIGSIGVLHPEVLENYKLKYPVTCFEINLEKLF